MAELAENGNGHLAHLTGTDRAEGRDEPILWRAELPHVVAPRFVDVDERDSDRAKVAVGGTEDLGDTVDRGSRWNVSHEMRDQFRGDES
jgi:hypothetical protein